MLLRHLIIIPTPNIFTHYNRSAFPVLENRELFFLGTQKARLANDSIIQLFTAFWACKL